MKLPWTDIILCYNVFVKQKRKGENVTELIGPTSNSFKPQIEKYKILIKTHLELTKK